MSANLETAKQFAREHLAACAQDIITWDTTGNLPEGRFKELAEIAKDCTPAHHLRFAEDVVKTVALETVAKLPKS